jgi:hypothetical protein
MKIRMKMTFPILLYIVSMSIRSCIEPFEPELIKNDSESMLVVAGQITDEEGPFKVRLTTSVPVNKTFNLIPVMNADVRVFDDKGLSIRLYGNKDGLYESTDKNLKGIPGNSYTLSILTAEGIEYESSSVVMQDVPHIDSIYFEEISHKRFEQDLVFEDIRMNILVDASDKSKEINYWRYEFEETWEVKMLTDDILVDHSPPGSTAEDTYENIDIDDEKRICWVTLPSASINVVSTTSSPSGELKRFPLTSIGPGEDKLHIRYSILVRQTSINRELYGFLKQLSEANEDAGGIYGKIPSQVYGNIKSCDGTTNALGYFSASSVKEKRFFINNYEHQLKTSSAYKTCIYFDYWQQPWIPKSYFGTITNTSNSVYCNSAFCADCRDYGTNIKPLFWD